ncbi:hypothetical protein DMB90_10290 [Raoultella planticola]|uniref:ABC-type transport auxiliary lipoprotein component domain-containing protein n=1 Tax=Raoultella planticola TaxID=575 RepID=A0A5P6A9R6_RAOPL|nr:hypothetical protein DMB90_10290 [Raoultella planticola]
MRIQIQLRRFDLWPGNQVRLDADWSLSTRNGGQRQRLLCQSRFSMSAPADYLQVFPVAQRRLLCSRSRLQTPLHTGTLLSQPVVHNKITM